MHALSTVVFFVAVAYATAGLIGAPLLGGPLDSGAIIQGPSGSIVRSGLGAGLVGPAIAPLGLGLGLHRGLALAVPAGSGLEGQWIPDINEKLYDDGSYKPLVYGL